MLMNGITSNLKELDDHIRKLENEIAVLKSQNDLHVKYNEQSVKEAKIDMSKRLDGMNEFRDQLKDQAGSFVTHDVFDAKYRSLEIKIEAIQKIVWGALAIVSFLTFAVPMLLKFIN